MLALGAQVGHRRTGRAAGLAAGLSAGPAGCALT